MRARTTGRGPNPSTCSPTTSSGSRTRRSTRSGSGSTTTSDACSRSPTSSLPSVDEYPGEALFQFAEAALNEFAELDEQDGNGTGPDLPILFIRGVVRFLPWMLVLILMG